MLKAYASRSDTRWVDVQNTKTGGAFRLTYEDFTAKYAVVGHGLDETGKFYYVIERHLWEGNG